MNSIFKEVYKKYFYLPKHGKVQERVFLSRIAVSITVIVLCLAAMSATAYAYFTHGNAQVVGVITSANFEVEVSDGTNTSNRFSYPVGTYGEMEFTISKTAESTASSGFCKINVCAADGVVQTFYTEPIGTYIKNGEQVTKNEIKVLLSVAEMEIVNVEFISIWGSYSGTDAVADGGLITPEYSVKGTPVNTEENK